MTDTTTIEPTVEQPLQETKPEIKPYASAAEMLADFEDDLVVHEVEVLGRKFFIKELNFYELLDVETRRLQVHKNQVQRNPTKEAKLGFALEFAACVMKPEGDSYASMFDVNSVQEFFSKPKAKELINGIAEQIYRINPTLDPLNKFRAATIATNATTGSDE